MSIFLEVIVTSVAEAIAAEQGGADRLELVRDLDQGGLTPALTLVKDVTSRVAIPVRVMVRETASMSVSDASEMARLQDTICEFSQHRVDGLVLGFLHHGQVDRDSLDSLLRSECLPDEVRITFHRAFDEAADPLSAIAVLKSYAQIDRILTSAGDTPWPTRRARLEEWQSNAGPTIQMLLAIGRDTSGLSELIRSPQRYEVHVGRAARVSHTNSGAVSAAYVSALKGEGAGYACDQRL